MSGDTETVRAKEIAIEISAPHNENVIFQPQQRVLRGEWLKSRLPSGVVFREGAGLMKVDRLPGLYVCLDIAGKRGRVLDPLSFRENRKLLREAAALMLGAGFTYQPVEEQILEDMNDSQVATWHHWMLQLVKDGFAKLVEGSAPFPKEPPKGRVKIDFFNGSATAPRYKDQFDRLREQRDADPFAAAGVGVH